MEVSDFVWRKHSRALAAFSVDPAVMYSLSSRRTATMPCKCLLRAVRVGRPAIAPHQLQAESLSEMKLAGSQTRSPPSHFPMPAFSRQFKSSSPDAGNLRTTSLSGKLRSLSWAAIVPSAMFGRVTYFSSLTVVCALSSISSIIMTISWLSGGAAHLSATVPSSRTRGIYPAHGKSEVSSSSIGSSLNCTDGHCRVERRCVRQQGSLLVVYF